MLFNQVKSPCRCYAMSSSMWRWILSVRCAYGRSGTLLLFFSNYALAVMPTNFAIANITPGLIIVSYPVTRMRESAVRGQSGQVLLKEGTFRVRRSGRSPACHRLRFAIMGRLGSAVTVTPLFRCRSRRGHQCRGALCRP